MNTRTFRGLAVLCAVLGGVYGPGPLASDHGDVPLTPAGMQRFDANLSDLHVFVAGDNLVLALSTNTAIPIGATSYQFPTDVTFEIHIDVDSPVDPADPTLLDGGTVIEPDRIQEDITYRIRFRDDGSVKLQELRRQRGKPKGSALEERAVAVEIAESAGASHKPPRGLGAIFFGLRDDPFIRVPRRGRNVGSIVIEVPLANVLRDQSTILVWATSEVEEFEGTVRDHAGRSLKSMFGENAAMNAMHPREHLRRMGMTPDVVIYDTALPAHFPNGRALGDDVVDIVNDPRVMASEIPPVDANDVEFLTAFPFLAPPH